MPGDFNKPVNTDAYATLLQFIRENLAELAKGLDASTAANIPSGAIRFNSTTKRWEKWNGSSWSELVAKASAFYDIRTAQADDIVVGASTAKAQGQVGPAAGAVGVSNANSYLASGSWFVANADATTNWPEAGVGGILKVDANSTGNYIRQTFFVYNANRMHSRYSTDSGATWSAWKHVTADADWDAASGADGFIANKPTLGTAASANKQINSRDITTGALMAVGAFGLGANCPVYTGDFDYIDETSFYYTTASNTTNGPGVAGYVLTLKYTSMYHAQLFFMSTGPDKYYRVQIDGTWTSWAKWHDNATMLGAVSQSGGIPTGAIIERGSNANGDFVKFADGTMICKSYVYNANVNTASGNLFRSGNPKTWVYPVAFVGSQPIVICMATNPARFGSVSNVTYSSAVLHQLCGIQSDTNIEMRGLAYGRWF